MRVALCQMNPTVGDLAGNEAKILRGIADAVRAGADLVVFPELALCGYPPQDLLTQDHFLVECVKATERIVRQVPATITAVFGVPERTGRDVGRNVYNSAVVARGGAVLDVVRKRLLPTYDVFDEDRYFEPGIPSTLVDVAGAKVGITICEDVWNAVGGVVVRRRYDQNPVADVVAEGATLLVNLSASPFTREKRVGRAEMLAGVARRNGMPLVFVNQVGGNDALLFDGSSALFAADGTIAARAPAFREALLVCDVAAGGSVADQPSSDEGAVLDALVMGVRDYAAKCGFTKAVLGLSGGVDSALTACIAAEALGPENVIGVAMPTRFSSAGSRIDAQALADVLGIVFDVVDIDPIFQAHIDGLTPHLNALAKAGEGDVTFENIQARIRCATLMAVSNRTGALLLTTGNKSEVAVGYCTLYGDMAGGLAVISDLPKTFVYKVAREVNRREAKNVIPESTLTKVPSAELRPNQTDQDSLPPYDVLDGILEQLVEKTASVADVVATGFDRAITERVAHLLRISEYKRQQMPPGLIVSRKAFGPGRRYPIAQRFEG